MTTRRTFLKKAALTTAGFTLPTLSTRATLPTSHTVPFTEGGSADIIVAGGGPAGIAAAITAARAGKKVVLLEMQGCLGGIWTSGLCCCLIDFGRGTIAHELIQRLDSLHARIPRRAKMLDSNFLLMPEYTKLILERMCTEAGVRFVLHCPVVAVEKDASGRNITSVYTESKSGRQRWTAKAFIDTTGDGDLAARAGCGFDFGGLNPGDNDQPASLLGFVVVDDDEALREFITNYPGVFGTDGKPLFDAKKNLREEAHRCGSDAAAPVLAWLGKNLLSISSGFEYGVPVDDAEAITQATVHAREEMFQLIQALVANGGKRWQGMRLVNTSTYIGQRAARRIHGLYTITTDDAVQGATFPDAVAHSNFCFDVHTTQKGEGYNVDYGVRSKPFQIPFRSCQSYDVDNLYMAGRCISGGFLPMSSYRVTGSAVEMGENVAKRVCEIISNK